TDSGDIGIRKAQTGRRGYAFRVVAGAASRFLESLIKRIEAGALRLRLQSQNRYKTQGRQAKAPAPPVHTKVGQAFSLRVGQGFRTRVGQAFSLPMRDLRTTLHQISRRPSCVTRAPLPEFRT